MTIEKEAKEMDELNSIVCTCESFSGVSGKGEDCECSVIDARGNLNVYETDSIKIKMKR